MMKRAKKPKNPVVTTGNGSATGNRRPRTASRRAVPTTTTSRARSTSPRSGPWVPAPGKATKGSRITWQNPTHKLELQDRGDLSTEEEDAVHGQMRQYEDKIDDLMSHVGTLKSEVELQRALHALDAQDDLLDTSHRTMEKQDATLHTIEQELKDREKENYLLRKSVDITNMLVAEKDLDRSEKELLNREREQLMKKLIEVEMDGQAAQQHVRELRDVIRRLREDNRLTMTSAESVRLSKLKEAFFEKMADFEATNRALRRLLRDQHRSEGEALRLAEQRELLLRKIADGDALNERLHVDLRERDRCWEDLRSQLAAQREEAVTLSNLHESLEATRAHLQKQLRQKEGDCNRQAVQIRTIEGNLAQNKIEMDHLQDLVNTAKQRADSDKEALKKATRRTEELEALVDRVEDNSKTQIETLTARLHDKTAELTTLRLENERLKMNRSRREADESMVLLDEHQKEANRLQQSSEMELEKVKARLHQRLQELEPLPELLRTTELRLHEANEKLLGYERRNTDNTKLIAELTAKVENRGETVDSLRTKYSDSQEESRLLHTKMDASSTRLRELDEANKELSAQVARKEEAMHQLNMRLDEKARESGVLTRQLENALTDLRQQQDNARDRFSSKERTYQSRVADLESQLSQSRSEIARIKREKEENERKFNSRLFDLKDRLEQCHSTNRSMQNYVQFLKNSYANVFGESAPYGPTPLLKP